MTITLPLSHPLQTSVVVVPVAPMSGTGTAERVGTVCPQRRCHAHNAWRLRYLNETLNIALDNYTDPSFSNRTKRGLMNGLGQLSPMLFGTAMDEEVEELWERYNYFASLAANQNKANNKNSLHINRFEHAVQDIASNSRTVWTALNAVIEDVKGIHEMALINQALPALESVINSVLHTNNLVIQNVVDADRGRVTSSLLPVNDLQSFNERRKGTPCACHTPLLSPIGVVLDIRCYSY